MNKQFYATASPDRYDLLKNFARSNRREMTMAEEYIWSELRDKQLGVTFRRQCPIGDFIADFACLPLRLIIEIDGKYHESPEQRQDDESRSSSLAGMNYQVLRYTNEEVLNSLSAVINDIRQQIYRIQTNKNSPQ